VIGWWAWVDLNHRPRPYQYCGRWCRQLFGVHPSSESSSAPAKPEDYRDRYERLTGHSLRECPICHRGRMITIQIFAGRAFFAGHQRHVMIYPTRTQIALLKNSQPSSQRNCLVTQSTKGSILCPLQALKRPRVAPHPVHVRHYQWLALPAPSPIHQSEPEPTHLAAV
jgi:hypothetical protein